MPLSMEPTCGLGRSMRDTNVPFAGTVGASSHEHNNNSGNFETVDLYLRYLRLVRRDLRYRRSEDTIWYFQ